MPGQGGPRPGRPACRHRVCTAAPAASATAGAGGEPWAPVLWCSEPAARHSAPPDVAEPLSVLSLLLPGAECGGCGADVAVMGAFRTRVQETGPECPGCPPDRVPVVLGPTRQVQL